MTQDKYGNIEIDTSGYESSPIDEVLKDKKENTSPKTHRNWTSVLKENSEGTAFQQFLGNQGLSVFEAGVDDIKDYAEHVKEGNKESTVNAYLALLASFYSELRDLGVHDSNPAVYVLDTEDYEQAQVERNHHTVEEIGGFIGSVPEPRIQTAVLTLAKTGLRAGELCNLDLCCLHLDDPHYHDYLDERGVKLNQKIAERPDTMFIHSKIWAGSKMNGEERTDGNKRERETLIPVDSELKTSLLDWLSIRPDTESPAQPVFTTKSTQNKVYKRLRAANLHQNAIGKYAQEAGLAKPGQDSSDVDLHYFRHFFVTQMAKNRGDHSGGLDPMLIKYIRGDVLDDAILDIYTHDSWGVNVREEYLKNIYQFGIYD